MNSGSTGPQPSSSADLSRFESTILSMLLKHGPLAFIAVLFNSTIYSALSWNITSRNLLVPWLLLNYALAGARYFWQRRIDLTSVSENELRLLGKKLRVGIAASGILWGMIGGPLLNLGSPIHLAVSILVLAGMSAGAVSVYSSSFSAVCIFLFTSLLPLIGRLIFSGGADHLLLALMVALYLLLMTVFSKSQSKMSVHSLQLSLENADLLNTLNNASHELRTPLAAISGFSELLGNLSNISPQVKKYSDIIHRNSVYLNQLMNNILMMSSPKSHFQEEQCGTFSLRDQIRLATQILEIKLKEKNLSLRVVYEPGLPDNVYSNSVRFQQILLNLLCNAVKFTERGFISVAIGMRGQRLWVRVEDTGIGIAPSAQKRIFEPFFREHRRRSRDQEGSGLGLALSRHLARGLGGDLKLVSSDVGSGSVFELELPIGAKPNPNLGESQRAQEAKRLAGRHILIVDDAPDMCLLVRSRLEVEGAKVQSCSSGEEAVNVVNRAPDSFDLILMDINLPKMDGHSATENIRRLGFLRPVLAFSAYPIKEKEADRFKKSGFNEFVSKAVDCEKLISIVQSWVA